LFNAYRAEPLMLPLHFQELIEKKRQRKNHL